MATYSNTLLALSQSSPFGPTTLQSSDNVTLTLGTITLSPSVAVSQDAGAFTYNVSGSDFAVTGSALNFTSNAASAWNMAGGALTLSVKDNTASAFSLKEGDNAYLSLTTTNGSESIAIGNATTNPSISFLGTGAFAIGGNLSVAGNVTVSGQKMQVDSTVDLFHDNLLVISSGPTGVMDSGLLNERYYTNWGVADVTGTAQAGSGASTIKLASDDAGADDAYQGYSIAITGGTGAGQQRAILSNVAATKLATVDQPWAVALDATSVYGLYASADRFVGIIWNETLGAFRLGVTNADPGQADVTIETMGLLDVGALNVLTAAGSVKFSVSSVGDLAVAVDKFTVAAASGNTVIAGTGSVTGDFAVATNKFTVAAASGNTAVAGTLGVSGLLSVSASGISASAGSALNLGSATVAPSVATLTSVERDALTPANGMLIYNSTTAQFEGYDAAWGALGAGGSVPGTDNLTFTINQDNVGADEDAALYLKSGDGSLMRQGQITMAYPNSAGNGLNFAFNNTPAATDYGFGFYFTPTNGGAASGATDGGQGGQFFFAGGSGGAAGAGAGVPGVGGPITLRGGTGGMGGAGSTSGAVGGSVTISGGVGGMAAGGTAGSGGDLTLSGGLAASGQGNGAALTLNGGGGGNQGAATLTAKNIDIGISAVARAVNFATGAADQVVTVGSTSGASSLTLQAGSGGMTVTSSTFDVNASGAVTLDSSGGAISIGADDIDQAVNVATDGERVVTVGSVNGAASLSLRSGSGNFVQTAGGILDLNVTGAYTLDAASFSVDSTSASNVSVTGDDLTLSTITSGTLAVTSAGALNLTAAANLSASITGTMDLQASGNVTIDSSGGVISIGSDADAQAINIGTGAAARAITIGNATGATSVAVNGGTGAMSFGANAVAHTVTVGSATGAAATVIQSGTGNLSLSAGGSMLALSGTSAGTNYSYVVGFTANAAENVTAGDVLYFTSAGTVGLTDADASGKKFVIGIAAETITSGNAVRVASIPGQVVVVNTDTSGMTRGAPVYADATVAGGLVTTAPSGSGVVVFQVGYVHTAHATTGKIIYAPQFIAQFP